MARARTTEDEYRVMANYGQGWEEVHATKTRREARTTQQEYRVNCPGLDIKVTGPHRVPLTALA